MPKSISLARHLLSSSGIGSCWKKNFYRYSMPIQTRWMDNDQYGHVNNVVYYSYFDTVVNHFLQNKIPSSAYPKSVIGVVAETSCQYKTEISFPMLLECGVSACYVGNTSVVYLIGIFPEGSDTAAAAGYFVHVYVDPETRKPKKLPTDMVTVLNDFVNGADALSSVEKGTQAPESEQVD
eukprot:TRINITY_DN66937_c3_g11_i1.p1 TRINITY_DN66937_c3_g11~~TRINITY_DN66937_c3_g11_i1.p1  ORF type:complete len:180 (+),score=9.15 TRINITY_DN66937_c3_g11_i1:24-563(+)